MKYFPKRFRPFILQMIIVQIQAAHSIYHAERSFFDQNDGRNLGNYNYKDSSMKGFFYMPQNLQMKDKPIIFLRRAKSGNQARILNIDLSGLRKDKDLPTTHIGSRHKPPLGLLGIDISVLSRNPDPTLPIAVVHPKNIHNGKSIMSYDFDPKYDRLPIIKTKPVQTYLFLQKNDEKISPVLPVMHLPLKVMTTYHTILTNKKQDIGFDFNSGSSSDIESEQRYTANFILHLLYQLSSNNKMNGN